MPSKEFKHVFYKYFFLISGFAISFHATLKFHFFNGKNAKYLLQFHYDRNLQILPKNYNAIFEKDETLFQTKDSHGSYEWIIMLEKCGRLEFIVFHLMMIWVIGTYGN